MSGTDGIAICASDRVDSWPVLANSTPGQAIAAWAHYGITTGDNIYALSTDRAESRKMAIVR